MKCIVGPEFGVKMAALRFDFEASIGFGVELGVFEERQWILVIRRQNNRLTVITPPNCDEARPISIELMLPLAPLANHQSSYKLMRSSRTKRLMERYEKKVYAKDTSLPLLCGTLAQALIRSRVRVAKVLSAAYKSRHYGLHIEGICGL